MKNESLSIAETMIDAISDKKGKDIVLIEIGEVLPITEYFILASGSSTTQVRALSDGVEMKMKENGVLPLRIEGFREGRWILLDYGDIVVHIFHEEERDFYGLERFWGDVPQKQYEA